MKIASREADAYSFATAAALPLGQHCHQVVVKTMRHIGIIVGLLSIFVATQAQAQAWEGFVSREDRFVLSFPGAPSIKETEWIDIRGEARPARHYSAQRGNDIYSVTAVDFEDAEYTTTRGSFDHAATIYRMKGEVTFDAWAGIDRVDGHQLQITLADGRRIYFAAHYNMDRLYVIEANISARTAPPGQFQQSMVFLDEYGERVRYSHTGERMIRTDDLPEVLGGPDFEAPILEAGSDTYIP